MFLKDLLEVSRGLFSMVERDPGAQVMRDVRLGNTVKQVLPDEAKVTIDRRQRATSKCPRVSSIMGKRRIRVLKVGDQNQPVVAPKIRSTIVKKNCRRSKEPDGHSEDNCGNDKPNVRQNDGVLLFDLEDGCGREEVVELPSGAWILVPGDIG